VSALVAFGATDARPLSLLRRGLFRCVVSLCPFATVGVLWTMGVDPLATFPIGALLLAEAAVRRRVRDDDGRRGDGLASALARRSSETAARAVLFAGQGDLTTFRSTQADGPADGGVVGCSGQLG
jgi:hypothetical protein